MTQQDLDRLAALLIQRCQPETVAALLNDFLCIEADPEYTDKEVDLGMAFFDALYTNATNKIVFLATGISNAKNEFKEGNKLEVSEIYGN